MFKFIHAADIHLDSPLKGLERYDGAPAEECRGATRRALENLVELAVEERVAFVLIVGDLYDGDWPDYNTGLYFGTQVARLRDAHIPVYLIRGNHDAQNKMTKDLRKLDNLEIFSTDRAQTMHLDECGVAIHGRSYPRRDVTENLAKGYPDGVRGCFNLGLLHTCATGREGHESYAPCTIDDLRFREYGYWALGHIHAREILNGDPPVIFPGNVQGRHIREHGAKGCMLVTVDDANEVTSIEHRRLDVVRWEWCRVDASGAVDDEEILGRFADRLAELLTDSDDRLLAIRVEILGACPAHDRLAADWLHWTNEVRLRAIEIGGGQAWVEKVRGRTSPPRSLEDDAFSDGPLAELGGLLEELRLDETRLVALGGKELIDLKKKLPGELREGLDHPARLRELLDQIGPMLMGRLRA